MGVIREGDNMAAGRRDWRAESLAEFLLQIVSVENVVIFITEVVLIRSAQSYPVSNHRFCPNGYFRIDPKIPTA